MSVMPQLKPYAVGDGVYQLSSLGARVMAVEHEGDLMLVDTGARGRRRQSHTGLAARMHPDSNRIDRNTKRPLVQHKSHSAGWN